MTDRSAASAPLFEPIFECFAIGLALTDLQGVLMAANRKMRVLLQMSPGPSLQRGRLIWPSEPGVQHQNKFQKTFGNRPLGAIRLVTDFVPHGTIFQLKSIELDGQIHALIASFSAQGRNALSVNAFATYVGLTARETNVAALLAEGMTASHIATELDLAINTVRTHVRHIFMKAAVQNQNELLAMMYPFSVLADFTSSSPSS